jgi:hypothetical protein
VRVGEPAAITLHRFPRVEVRVITSDGSIPQGVVGLTLTITTGDGTIEVAGEVLRLQQEFTAGDIRRAFAVRFARTITLPA